MSLTGANFSKLGLHPGMATTYILPRLVGMSKAMELIFTGTQSPVLRSPHPQYWPAMPHPPISHHVYHTTPLSAMLTGDLVDGEEAAKIGLANYAEQGVELVLSRALQIASKIAANAPLSVKWSKVGNNE